MQTEDLLEHGDIVVRWCQEYRLPSQRRFPVRDSEEYSVAWLGLLRAYYSFDADRRTRDGRAVPFRMHASANIKYELGRYARAGRAKKRGGVGTNNFVRRLRVFCFTDLDDSSYDGYRFDAPSPAEANLDLSEWCWSMLAKLPQRDAEVVQAVAMYGESLRSVAQRYGLSHTRISEIYQRGLARLRKVAGECPVVQ